ncbi:MAG TPA: RND family transporter [Firmicutes bacterium]|nr:RND family transporter [Bacillota bacterium]
MIQWFKSIFEKTLPRFAVKYPWLVLIVFVLVTGFFGYQLTNIYVDTDVTKLTTGSEEETRAIETAARDFTVGDPLYLILKGDMNDPQVLQKANNLISEIRGHKDVFEVISPFDTSYFGLAGFMVQSIPVAPQVPATEAEVKAFRQRLAQSPNGKRMISADSEAMLIELYIYGSYSSRGKRAVKELEKLLTTEWGSDQFNMTGTSYITHAMDQSIRRDAFVLFPIAALIVVIVLILSFRSWLGFLIPGATVLVSMVITMGLMAWLDFPITLVSVIMPVILIVIGSADGIHILHKYQEELGRNSASKNEIVARVMEKMVPPCTMTSVTTAVGLISLRTSTVIPVKDFGTFSGIGVMVAYVFTLLGIPALLAVFPEPKRLSREAKQETYWDTIFLAKLARWVMRHSKTVAVIGTAVFVIMALGLPRITVEANIARYFRKSSDAAEGIRVYEQYFGGSQQVLIVVDTHQAQGALNPQFLPTIDELEQYAQTVPLVTHTWSMASLARDLSPDGQLQPNLVPLAYQQLPRTLTSVFVSRNQQQKAMIYAWLRSSDTTQLANNLISLETGLKERLPEGYTVTVSGLPKIIQHHMQRFSESQVSSVLWSTLAVLALLIIFTRSFLEGCISVIPLIFTIVINFGVMGWLGLPLDAATVLIGSIAIGMGIDYSIHYISRVNSEVKAGKNLMDACEIAISTAGHAIMINAATLIAGFLMLCFSTFSILMVFGVLMALAMGISCIATVTVLPVMLQILRNKFSRRVHSA